MRSRRLNTLLIASLVASVAFAQVSIPASPAGKVLETWLEAMNATAEGAAGRSKLEAFQKTYAPDRPDMPERFAGLTGQTGGVDVAAITEDKPERITATLKHRNGSGYTSLTFAVAGEPPQLAGVRLSPGHSPDEQRASVKALEPDELNRALDAEAQKINFSGTMLVARDGKVVFEKAYGFADRERKIPNTLDMPFRMGSMNKMFTAVAILQLVDRGSVDLDAPLARYLTDYPNKEAAAKITIRHLLTHTAGTGDILTPEFAKFRLSLKEPRDYIQLFGGRPLKFEPGSRWDYSNFGFVILGRVVEAVSGMSYYNYVRKNIFEPAEMKDTDSLPESEIRGKVAIGYVRAAGGERTNADTLPYRGTPAGGGYTTVRDLLKFARALQRGTILPAKWLAEAAKVQVSQGPGYGYGFMVEGSGKKAFFGHNGGAPGMNGELRIYPKAGIVIAALANTDPPAASELVEFFDQHLPE